MLSRLSDEYGGNEPNPRYASDRELRAARYARDRRTGPEPVAETHWSRDADFARGWATRGNRGVVLHATDPKAPMSGAQQHNTGVYVRPEHARYAEHEKEVAVEPGAKVHVHGLAILGDNGQRWDSKTLRWYEAHPPEPDLRYSVDWRMHS